MARMPRTARTARMPRWLADYPDPKGVRPSRVRFRIEIRADFRGLYLSRHMFSGANL